MQTREVFNPPMGGMQGNCVAPYDFKIGELIRESWQRVGGAKASIWGALILVLCVYFFFVSLSIICVFLYGEDHSSVIINVLRLITILISLPMLIGVGYLGVRRSVDLPIKMSCIFIPYRSSYIKLIAIYAVNLIILYPLFFAFIFTMLLFPMPDELSTMSYTLLRFTQAILVFAIYYFSLAFMFSYMLIVEKHLGIWIAIKASFVAFSRRWFKITLTYLCMFLIYSLSLLPLCLGMIWTLPMIVILSGILYRTAFGVEEVR